MEIQDELGAAQRGPGEGPPPGGADQGQAGVEREGHLSDVVSILILFLTLVSPKGCVIYEKIREGCRRRR